MHPREEELLPKGGIVIVKIRVPPSASTTSPRRPPRGCSRRAGWWRRARWRWIPLARASSPREPGWKISTTTRTPPTWTPTWMPRGCSTATWRRRRGTPRGCCTCRSRTRSPRPGRRRRLERRRRFDGTRSNCSPRRWWLAWCRPSTGFAGTTSRRPRSCCRNWCSGRSSALDSFWKPGGWTRVWFAVYSRPKTRRRFSSTRSWRCRSSRGCRSGTTPPSPARACAIASGGC
mmetsp:Transcript_10998/g.47557  ORF Transcript_10998/g.47557 Transcript_10998/m.47557 type:complete len:232 (+) Transcript_10998:696-1391(+)